MSEHSGVIYFRHPNPHQTDLYLKVRRIKTQETLSFLINNYHGYSVILIDLDVLFSPSVDDVPNSIIIADLQESLQSDNSNSLIDDPSFLDFSTTQRQLNLSMNPLEELPDLPRQHPLPNSFYSTRGWLSDSF